MSITAINEEAVTKLAKIHSAHGVKEDIELGTISFRGPGNTLGQDSGISSAVETVVQTQALSDIASEEVEEEFPEGGLRAWSVVLGSFLGLVAVFGFINSLGAVQAYVSSNQLHNQSESQVSWIFSVFVFLGYGLSGQVGPIFDMYGSYYLCIAGSICFLASIMLTSVCNSYYQFFLAFGICGGIGVSLLMTPLIAVVGHWFNRKRGTALGAATVGGSLGGVVFPLMLRSLYEKVGFPWAMRCVGFLCAGLLFASFFLLKTRLPRSTSGRLFSVDNLPDLSALKDMRFVWLTVANFLGELAVLNGITYLVSFSLAQGKSQTFSYLLLTILNATGMLGRWAPGYAADYLGRFNTLIAICTMAFITIFAIWLPFGTSNGGLIAFAVLHGFCNGAFLSLSPVCCGQICLTRDYGKRYGTMFLFASFGVLLGIPLSGALIKGSDYSKLIILTGSLYVGTTIALLLSRHASVGFRWTKI